MPASHYSECNGALSAAVAEQGAQRDLLDNALAMKDSKIASRKDEVRRRAVVVRARR